MSKPFFSVIVPIHSDPETITRGLRSIDSQTFRDFETVFVCDNCTDDTIAWAKSFYPDKLIVTHHGMDGLARNTGIDAAEGEWIVFLDDDDWWLHEYVLEELHIAAMEECDMIVFDFIWKDPPPGRPGYFHNTDRRMNIAVWSKCFKRDLIGDTRFPAIPFTSDVQFMDDILKKRPAVHQTDQLMYYYNYLREGSQTEVHGRHDND